MLVFFSTIGYLISPASPFSDMDDCQASILKSDKDISSDHVHSYPSGSISELLARHPVAPVAVSKTNPASQMSTSHGSKVSSSMEPIPCLRQEDLNSPCSDDNRIPSNAVVMDSRISSHNPPSNPPPIAPGTSSRSNLLRRQSLMTPAEMRRQRMPTFVRTYREAKWLNLPQVSSSSALSSMTSLSSGGRGKLQAMRGLHSLDCAESLHPLGEEDYYLKSDSDNFNKNMNSPGPLRRCSVVNGQNVIVSRVPIIVNPSPADDLSKNVMALTAQVDGMADKYLVIRDGSNSNAHGEDRSDMESVDGEDDDENGNDTSRDESLVKSLLSPKDDDIDVHQSSASFSLPLSTNGNVLDLSVEGTSKVLVQKSEAMPVSSVHSNGSLTPYTRSASKTRVMNFAAMLRSRVLHQWEFGKETRDGKVDGADLEVKLPGKR